MYARMAKLLDEWRVVSVIGVGGVGKTRLAIQVGSEVLPAYEDGVWLCELAPVVEARDLHETVAAAVGYTPPQGVSVVDGLGRFLERKSLLLILDNCEHLIPDVADFVSRTTTPRGACVGAHDEPRGARCPRRAHRSPGSVGAPRRERRSVDPYIGGRRAFRDPRQ